MDLKKLKRHLMSQPGATESAAFGPEHLTFKVMVKHFAVVSWDEEPMRVSLKGDPAEVEALRMVFPAVQPPPYFNKKHWNLVVIDGSVPESEFLAMIDESYRLVVKGLTGKQRESLT